MSFRTGGTLGDVSQTEQASAALPWDTLPAKQREAWMEVSDHMRLNPGVSVAKACEARGITPNNYYLAKKKMEMLDGGAFTCRDGDLIRPDSAIVKNTRRREQDEEDAREAREAARRTVSRPPEAEEPEEESEASDAVADEDITPESALVNVMAWLRPLERDDKIRVLEAACWMLALRAIPEEGA